MIVGGERSRGPAGAAARAPASATWTATTVARVTAIAATVRRTTSPAVTPTARASTVMPIGTTPRAPKRSGQSRGNAEAGCCPCSPSATASSSGPAHHVSARPIEPATAAASAGDPELGGEPPGPGDALVPDQPVGAGLELAGDHRRAPEDADDRGDDVRQRRPDSEDGLLGVVRAELVEEVLAADADEVGELRAGDREGDRGQRQGAEDDERRSRGTVARSARSSECLQGRSGVRRCARPRERPM